MKRALSSALVTLALFFSSTAVFAQSTPVIKLSAPSNLQANEDVTVTIILEESDGSPFSTGVLPDITFSPADNVEDDVLYDCEIEDADNCGSNNRGAVGIFEALFRVTEFPVSVDVELNGVNKSLELTGSTAPEETAAAPANTPETNTESTAEDNATTSQSVQVGPSPLWFLMILITGFGAACCYSALASQKQ